MEAKNIDYKEIEKDYITQHVTEDDIYNFLLEEYEFGEINKWTMKRNLKRIKTCACWDCANKFVATKDLRQKIL